MRFLQKLISRPRICKRPRSLGMLCTSRFRGSSRQSSSVDQGPTLSISSVKNVWHIPQKFGAVLIAGHGGKTWTRPCRGSSITWQNSLCSLISSHVLCCSADADCDWTRLPNCHLVSHLPNLKECPGNLLLPYVGRCVRLWRGRFDISSTNGKSILHDTSSRRIKIIAQWLLSLLSRLRQMSRLTSAHQSGLHSGGLGPFWFLISFSFFFSFDFRQ